MASRKTTSRRTTTKKRAQRATSNVFAMFDQAQIQEFKEAFNMIDQNRDGFVDKEDLHDMLASLGKHCFIRNYIISWDGDCRSDFVCVCLLNEIIIAMNLSVSV